MNVSVLKRPVSRTGKERRSHKRRPARLEVRFFSENKFYSGTIYDLSEEGMFIHTKVYLPRNSILVVLLPSDDDVQVVARVRHSRRAVNMPGGIGVEVSAPPGNYMDYVRKNKGESYGQQKIMENPCQL